MLAEYRATAVPRGVPLASHRAHIGLAEVATRCLSREQFRELVARVITH